MLWSNTNALAMHASCWERSKMANSSCSSSAEGPAFSDSDMSADESSTSATHREKNLIQLLKQENRVLKMELETCKLRCKGLLEENRALRQLSVSIVSETWLCYIEAIVCFILVKLRMTIWVISLFFNQVLADLFVLLRENQKFWALPNFLETGCRVSCLMSVTPC